MATVEGVNCRSLKFYTHDNGRYELTSKVDNCHRGTSPLNLLVFADNFISYSNSDPAIKVWRMTSRKKQSIL